MATKSSRGRPKGSGIDDDKIIAKINKLLAKDSSLKPTTAIKAVGITDASSIRRLRDKLKSGAPVKRAAAKSKKPAAKKKAAPAKITAKTVKTRKPAKRTAAPKKAAASKKSVTTRTAASSKKKPAVKKKVATRTAAVSRAAPKVSSARKTVETRKAPGKAAQTPADIFTSMGMANPFADMAADMANGMAMPSMPTMPSMQTDLADLNIETIVSATVEKQIQLYESALKLSPMASLLKQQALLTDMILTLLRTQKEITKSLNIKN